MTSGRKAAHVAADFGALTLRTAVFAMAARRLGRPVKLVATLDQGFTIASNRAETRHRPRLGAGRDGRLVALIHEGEEVTSRPDNYEVAGTDASTRRYACPNVGSKVSMVHADRNTTGFMRSPPKTPYLFPLESAMDELTAALDMDSVELRRRNDTLNEPIGHLPYTSPPASRRRGEFLRLGSSRSAAGLDARGRLDYRLGLRVNDVPNADGAGDGAGDADAAGDCEGADRGP